VFHNVVVGVDDREIGRDELALAGRLAARDAEFTLVYVNVVHGKPARDSLRRRGTRASGCLRWDVCGPCEIRSASRHGSPAWRHDRHDMACTGSPAVTRLT